jgi:hypothetical protein
VLPFYAKSSRIKPCILGNTAATFYIFGKIMFKPLLLGGLSVALLAGCAVTPLGPPVIQRENNQFETTGAGKTRAIALQSAMTSANKTCGSNQTIVVQDVVKYNGLVDEKTGRLIEQVGGVVGVLTGMKNPQIARDDDYNVTVTFYCR